jgi:hypothetical protein
MRYVNTAKTRISKRPYCKLALIGNDRIIKQEIIQKVWFEYETPPITLKVVLKISGMTNKDIILRIFKPND